MGNVIEPVLNVLIAEDDDAAAHLIKTNLKRAGMDTVFHRAKNGEEVVKFLESETVPARDNLIILLDIRMPKMDGIQALKIIKSSPKWKKIPVTMLTTSDRSKEVEMCYALGCNSYLKKQVDYGKFVESIKIFADYTATCELPSFGEGTNE
jgi:CheY-like chemotaxis protein